MIGEVFSLHTGPEVFDGVEFRGIAGESLDAKPRGICSEIVLNDFRAVRRKAIPEEQNFSFLELAFQFFQKLNEIFALHAAGEYP